MTSPGVPSEGRRLMDEFHALIPETDDGDGFVSSESALLKLVQRERAAARREAIAERLRRLAIDYDFLGYGRTHPHTEEAAEASNRAKSLIRTLAEEWL